MPPFFITTALGTLSSILQRPLGQVPTEYDWIKYVDLTYHELKTNLKEINDLIRGRHLLLDDEDVKETIICLNRFCFDVDDRINEMKCLMEQKQSDSKHRKPVRDANKSKVWKARGLVDKLKEIKALFVDVQAKLLEDDQGGSSHVNFDQLESMNRDDTGRSIIDKLMEQDKVGVSIIGIRGLGKRALANYIVDHADIRNKFSLILKASFSDITFEDLKDLKPDFLHDTRRVKGIVHCLKEKQWLLWVDDLSDVKSTFWSQFYSSYLAKANGSRKVLITTVNPTVARATVTFPIYLQDLSDNYCQQLIEKKISSLDSNHSVRNDTIHKEVEKCYGLPSIAIFVAWENFKNWKADDKQIIDKQLWKVPKFQDELLPYLASSFWNLNSRLLKCVCYLSLFPQDYPFNKEDLILLYIGVGLVETHLSSLLENDCFENLVENSLLQAKNDNSSSTYQMNRFTQSLVQYAAPKTCAIVRTFSDH